MQAIETWLSKTAKDLILIEINASEKPELMPELFIIDEKERIVMKDLLTELKVEVNMTDWESGWYRIELFYEGFLHYYNHIRKL